MPDSLGFGSRQRPEHPARLQPDSRTTGNTPHAQPLPCIQRDSCQTNRLQASHALTLKRPSSQHPSSRHPAPAPPAIRSQQSFPSGNSRQLPAQAFTSRTRNTHKLPQAPLPPSERPAILRVPSSLPSTGQSSERAPSFPRQTLARIAAPTHLPPKSRTPPGIPKSPNSSRHPYTPIPSPGIPKHKKTEPALRRLRSKLFTGIYSIVPISV